MNKLKKKYIPDESPCATCSLSFNEQAACCGCPKYFEWEKKEEERKRRMKTIEPSENCVCREIVTKERLYDRLNNSIKQCEMTIMREEVRLATLRDTKRNLDEYFEDLIKGEEL